MIDKKSNFQSVLNLFRRAEIWPDEGQELVYLPGFKFSSNGKIIQMDALLCPHKRDGYETRLFLQEPINNKGQNWKTFHICGRTWHACSFQGVPENIPWMQILAQHLRHLS